MKLQAFDPQAAQHARRVLEYNPYHGKDGRFTGKSGAASSVAYAGKRPAGIGKGKAAIRRETGADAETKRIFPNGPTSRSFQASSGGKNRQHGRAASLYGEARRLRQAGDAAGSKAAASAAGRERYAASGNESVRRPQRNDYREQVPQDLKKYTRRGGEGRIPRRFEGAQLTGSLGAGPLADQVTRRRLGTEGAKHEKQIYHAAASAAYGSARRTRGAPRATDRALADRYRAHAAKLGGGETRERVPQNPKKYTAGERVSSGSISRAWKKNLMDERKRAGNDGWSPLLSQDQAAADYTPRSLRSAASNEYGFARRLKKQGAGRDEVDSARKRAEQYTADAKAGKVR